MKSIDEIRNMSLEDLEGISREGSVAAPAGLADRSLSLIRSSRIRRRTALAACAALVLVAGAGLLLWDRLGAPQDTFTDPYLAYAEVEKAFSIIGDTARNSARVVESSRELYIDRINGIYTINE